MRDPQRASTYLKQSREISMGKSWTAKRELEGAQHTIFTESCTFLYRALLEEAKGLINVSPSKGQRICTIARRRANDGTEIKGKFQHLTRICSRFFTSVDLRKNSKRFNF